MKIRHGVALLVGLATGVSLAQAGSDSTQAVPGGTAAPRTAPATAKPAADAGPAKPSTSQHGPKFDAVTFLIRHRVFHDYGEMQKVKLNKDFPLGDTEFSARVVQYVPDFQMDLERHKIFSLTNQPNNPAFKVIVRKGKVPQDTSWAFLNNPPHFGAKSYFAFKVMRIDFLDHAPLLADTIAKAPAHMTGHGATGATHAPAGPDSARKP